ncbi:DUF177 domain-containing protein [Acutalibacter sp. 1XD8-33]|uniref:YceD family protein n=1 Tax=Acutalibacter sp. 1XD8-33 TaxID=2320081 RepID=UPI000EA3E37A|nr:DUF177 domain-containing protein [Acutalibacter sp. 1XD8-33]RKJ39018.1 DUF177 domain-containing protein [Acutalibacter sp. 1XD8-33]
MVLDLKKLFRGDGVEESAACELDFSGVELGGAKPFCAPVKVQARMRSFAGSVDFRAQVAYTLSMPCDRCAEMVVRDYEKSFVHTLVRETQNEEDDRLILVPEERLDLDGLILEDVLLDLPGQFLCREDCKGLCPRCGKNWNEGLCACGAPAADPRLEVLRQLLEKE